MLFPALLLVAVPAQESGISQMAEQASSFTLDNGLRVVVLPRGEAPVVSFQIYVQTGSMDEISGFTGLAHFAEHMAFKGSSRIGARNWLAEEEALRRVDEAWTRYESATHAPSGEFTPKELEALRARFEALDERAMNMANAGAFDAAVEGAGGLNQNATTGADATRYFVSLPANRLETWFWLTREQIGRPVMREFYRERDVVMEERRTRTDSSPVGAGIESLLNSAFVAHPYRDSTIGHMDDLKNLDRPEMISFWDRHYTADRMVIAIVGRVDPAYVQALAEQYLGGLPGPGEPRPRRTKEPIQGGEKVVMLARPSSPMVLLGWKIPSLVGRQRLIFDALADVLYGGPSARAQDRLIKREAVASFIEGFSGFPGRVDPNLLVTLIGLIPGASPQQAVEILQEEMTRLAAEGLRPDEMQGMKRRIKMKLLEQLSTNMGIAEALAESEAEDGGWETVFSTLSILDSITPDEIQSVAGELLADSRTTVYILPPGMQADGSTSLAPAEEQSP
ncbi:MAG: insulinase family protein [Planctomycetes bacterium]|nr:insulinase family protein [Planctomycetota bacterium]